MAYKPIDLTRDEAQLLVEAIESWTSLRPGARGAPIDTKFEKDHFELVQCRLDTLRTRFLRHYGHRLTGPGEGYVEEPAAITPPTPVPFEGDVQDAMDHLKQVLGEDDYNLSALDLLARRWNNPGGLLADELDQQLEALEEAAAAEREWEDVPQEEGVRMQDNEPFDESDQQLAALHEAAEIPDWLLADPLEEDVQAQDIEPFDEPDLSNEPPDEDDRLFDGPDEDEEAP